MKTLYQRNRAYRLYNVAQRLGIAKSSLVDILSSHGFSVGHSYDQLLTFAQVEMIAKLYVEAVNSQFHEMLKHRHELGEQADEMLWHFEHYTRHEEPLFGKLDPADWQLEDDLITERFYAIISRVRSNASIYFGVAKSIIKRLVKVVRTYSVVANQGINSIIPPKLFFIYSDEEDSYSFAFKTGSAVAGT